MSKHIKINTCSDCPHKDHKGLFCTVSYVPCCNIAERKELPHEVETDRRLGQVARYNGAIPTWCPLEDFEA